MRASPGAVDSGERSVLCGTEPIIALGLSRAEELLQCRATRFLATKFCICSHDASYSKKPPNGIDRGPGKHNYTKQHTDSDYRYQGPFPPLVKSYTGTEGLDAKDVRHDVLYPPCGRTESLGMV